MVLCFLLFCSFFLLKTKSYSAQGEIASTLPPPSSAASLSNDIDGESLTDAQLLELEKEVEMEMDKFVGKVHMAPPCSTFSTPVQPAQPHVFQGQPEVQIIPQPGTMFFNADGTPYRSPLQHPSQQPQGAGPAQQDCSIFS